MKQKETGGFTLVELMVVITIIAILAGIVIASVSGSKKNTNYLKRTAELGQMNLVIQRYNVSVGKYPPGKDTQWTTTGTCTALTSAVRVNYIFFVVPTYTASLPVDIKKATDCANGPMYAYKSDGRDYKLIVYNNQEDKNIVLKKNPELIDPVRGSTSTTPSFGYWTPGAASW
jgi:prepilin-type N-terminal cleavage/methylation domain-containing protein